MYHTQYVLMICTLVQARKHRTSQWSTILLILVLNRVHIYLYTKYRSSSDESNRILMYDSGASSRKFSRHTTTRYEMPACSFPFHALTQTHTPGDASVLPPDNPTAVPPKPCLKEYAGRGGYEVTADDREDSGPGCSTGDSDASEVSMGGSEMESPLLGGPAGGLW